MSDGLRRMKSRSQVEPSPYRRAAYDSKGHLISYWHQINDILRQGPDHILGIDLLHDRAAISRLKPLTVPRTNEA
jgi:hypothetical protein